MIQEFNNWLQESEKNLAFPSFISKLENEGNCKMLPLKYVIMFDDKNLNELVQVFYQANFENFRIQKIGKYFNGTHTEVRTYREMLNYVKLYEIASRFKKPELTNYLYFTIVHNPQLTFDKLGKLFYEEILSNKLEVSKDIMAAIGITDTVIASTKFGI